MNVQLEKAYGKWWRIGSCFGDNPNITSAGVLTVDEGKPQELRDEISIRGWLHNHGGQLLVLNDDEPQWMGEMTADVAETATSCREVYSGCLAAGGRSETWHGSLDGVHWHNISPVPSTRTVQNDRPTGWEKTGDFREESADRGLRSWHQWNWVLRVCKWDTVNSFGSARQVWRVTGHKTSLSRRTRRLAARFG